MGSCTFDLLGQTWSAKWTRREGTRVSSRLVQLMGKEQSAAIMTGISNAQSTHEDGKDALKSILFGVLGASGIALSSDADLLNDLLDMVQEEDAVEALEPVDQLTLAVFTAWEGGFFILGSPSRMRQIAGQDSTQSQDNPQPSPTG